MGHCMTIANMNLSSSIVLYVSRMIIGNKKAAQIICEKLNYNIFIYYLVNKKTSLRNHLFDSMTKFTSD